jgi:hypothetical protein
MPDLGFECVGGAVARYAAVPTVTLTVRVTEAAGVRVQAVALRCQIRLEPHRRRYDGTEAEAMVDLFGEPARWGESLKPIQLTTLSVMVSGFSGSTEVELPVTFSYDLEIASTKYLRGLRGGAVPLLLLFSGTVFTEGPRGYAVEQVPWSKETSYRLPVEVWQEAVERNFPHSGWLRLDLDTLDALRRYKSRHALPTWDGTVLALLAAAGAGEPVR